MAPDSRRPPTGATSSPMVRAMRKEKVESDLSSSLKEVVAGQKEIVACLQKVVTGQQQLLTGQQQLVQQLLTGHQQLVTEIRSLKNIIKRETPDDDVAIETEDDADSGCEENVMHSWS